MYKKRPLFILPHYAYIASSLKAARPSNQFDYEVWLRAVHTLAHDLGVDNKFFDKKKFYKECGQTSTFN